MASLKRNIMTNSKPTPLDTPVLEAEREAYEWLAIINSDGATDYEHTKFDRWLNADPIHQAVFNRAEGVFSDVSRLEDLNPLAAGDASSKSLAFGTTIVASMKKLVSRPLTASGAIAAMAAIVLLFYPPQNDPQPLQRHATQVAEVQEISLEDGSTVTLSAKSVAEVDFAKAERRIALIRGQAFFDVASDPSKPFSVITDNAKIAVIGTRFEVLRIQEETRVAVVEGVVKLSARDALNNSITITKGQAASIFDNGRITDVVPVKLNRISAWRNGRLIYDETPFSDVVTELNRYTIRPLEIAPEVNRAITITGAFSIDDAEGVVNALAAANDLEIKPNIKGGRTLHPKKENIK